MYSDGADRTTSDLIELERISPYPFAASSNPVESPRHAYELIKLELANHLELYYDRCGKFPATDELHYEACRIIFTAESSSISSGHGPPSSSWLRDLIMSVGDIVERAKLSPLRFNIQNRVTCLKIIGKGSLFENCPLEDRLLRFVHEHGPGSLTDVDLQQMARTIIQEEEEESSSPSELIVTWFLQLISSSTAWLTDFCLRAQIPFTPQVPATVVDSRRGTESANIDSIIENYNRLDQRLLEYVEMLQTHGIQPDDESLLQKGLSLIAEMDNDEWKAVASQSHSWLLRFKRRHVPWIGLGDGGGTKMLGITTPDGTETGARRRQFPVKGQSGDSQPEPSTVASELRALSPFSLTVSGRRKKAYFFNDAGFDRWIGRQLARWVAGTMSVHNPNRHIPTDEELQHQARWIGYQELVASLC